MCGIAGWLGSFPDDRKSASRVVKALRHRGPDGQGIQSWPEATLVHTRLSIIDTSPAGAQPMANEDGTVWTVFNGEIYNHRELRHYLKNRGHSFRGRSDTEVLPHLYEEEGAAFIAKLRGMFALAIYDTRTKSLLLARDRFGIKPLYYAPANDRLAFASEIRALLCLPGIDDRPDRQAIFDLAALFYIPAPQTFYTGIRALQPGEVLEAHINSNGAVSLRTHFYHQWKITSNPGLALSEAADRAEELLTSAVSSQLESDVPLGAFLSGGIDSSLVSVAAQKASGENLRTFNVRFAEKEYDETWAALAVAKQLGSNHQTLDMDGSRGTWDYITDLLLQAGQPYGDSSLFPANAICRLMRNHVTVALSGDGGDEGFGGYSLYWRIGRILRLQRFPQSVWRAAHAIISPMARRGLAPWHWPHRINDLVHADNTAIVQTMFTQISGSFHRSLCQDRNCLPIRRLFEPQWEQNHSPETSRLERLSRHATEVNTRLELPNDFLFKVDTASMKESLEIRVPLLDEDLISFGFTLPYHLKVHARTCKRVLREVARRRLPPEVANKPKQGFAIPFDSWADGGFKARLREVLLDSSSKLHEFFRPEVYRPLLLAFCDNHPFPGVSPHALHRLAIVLLSVQFALDGAYKESVQT